MILTTISVIKKSLSNSSMILTTVYVAQLVVPHLSTTRKTSQDCVND